MKTFMIKYKSILNYIVGICLIQGVISDYIGFRQINYLCDLLLIVLFILMICKKKLFIKNINENLEYISLLIFILVILIGWGLNSVSVLRALWGIRNYGRFILFYIFARELWT